LGSQELQATLLGYFTILAHPNGSWVNEILKISGIVNINNAKQLLYIVNYILKLNSKCETL